MDGKKEFEKRKKEFLKFPSNMDNMGRRMIFMDVKKKYQRTLYFAELNRIEQRNKKALRQLWTAVKSLLYDTMRNRSNSIHPNTWKPYFQKT